MAAGSDGVSMSGADDGRPSRRLTGSISALWAAVTGRRSEAEARPSASALARRWVGARIVGGTPSAPPAAVPPVDPDALDAPPVVERRRDGVCATLADGLLCARLEGPPPPFGFVPARDAAPPRIRGDRVAGQIALADPARPAVRAAIADGAVFEEGRWQIRLRGEAARDPDAIIALAERLIDAARALRDPVEPPSTGWLDCPPALRLRLLVLCHLDAHPETGTVRSLAMRDPEPTVRAVADGLRRRGFLPTLISPPVPADLRGEMIGRLEAGSRASALATALADPDPTAAVAVVPHLAADGIAALTPALCAPHADVRLAAVRALMTAPGDRLVPATDAIGDRDPRVVRAAATVLAWFGGEAHARAMRARAAAAADPALAEVLEEAARAIIRRYDAAGQGARARANLGYPSAEAEARHAGRAPPAEEE